MFPSHDRVGEVYTAPRHNPFILNHAYIFINPNFGIQRDNYFVTLSIGFRYHIPGNNTGMTPGWELFNTLRAGIKM